MTRVNRTSITALAAMGTLALCLAGPALAEPDAPATVQEGVFTAEQAETGLGVYQDNCQQCHAEDMRGGPGAPTLVGPAFQFVWDEESVGELYRFVKESMPPGAPGSLSDQEYADVLAAIFEENGFAPGDNVLPPDPEVLDDITITPAD